MNWAHENCHMVLAHWAAFSPTTTRVKLERECYKSSGSSKLYFWEGDKLGSSTNYSERMLYSSVAMWWTDLCSPLTSNLRIPCWYLKLCTHLSKNIQFTHSKFLPRLCTKRTISAGLCSPVVLRGSGINSMGLMTHFLKKIFARVPVGYLILGIQVVAVASGGGFLVQFRLVHWVQLHLDHSDAVIGITAMATSRSDYCNMLHLGLPLETAVSAESSGLWGHWRSMIQICWTVAPAAYWLPVCFQYQPLGCVEPHRCQASKIRKAIENHFRFLIKIRKSFSLFFFIV